MSTIQITTTQKTWKPQTFQPMTDVAGMGSAIATDQHHTYFLHYTSGLSILEPGQANPTFIDLSALSYMRDLLIDQKGNLWVGGWKQLVRLRCQGNQWSQDHYRLTHSVLISP
ncbi:hypothetical protein [Acaryochloris marina]|uniref:hypothetical protein n=1 Tax=Acaryochloris marina TaxID=155978 RepID=UPI00201718B2|nr:hypothetical protein [Acaryochloris marina]